MIMTLNNDQYNELKMCENSILYFANKYIKISDNISVKQITLNDFQRDVIEKYEGSNSFFLSGERMVGKTTVAAIILLHEALFNSKNSSAIFAPKQVMSDYTLELIAEMYERLPNFLTISKIVSRNKNRLQFDNDSCILSAGPQPQLLTGIDVSTVYIDESEFMSDDLNRVIADSIVKLTTKQSSKLFILSSIRTAEILKAVKGS